MLKGKGIWIEDLATTDNEGDPATLVGLAQQAGFRHIILKVADGDSPMDDDRIDNALRAFQGAGFAIWGAHRVHGDNVDAEARMSAQVVEALSLDGLVVVAESDYIGKHAQAAAYMDALNNALPNLTVGLSSYRFPNVQGAPGGPESQTFPFDAFLSRCDVALPKVFWVARDGGDPANQLRESLHQYKARWPHRPYIPIGAAYGVSYGDFWWSATPAAITAFLAQAKMLALPAVSFWCWSTARHDQNNHEYPATELWDAIARFPYEDPFSPEEPFVEDVTVRPGDPGYAEGLYENAPQPDQTFQVLTLPDGRTIRWKGTTWKQSDVWARWTPHLTEPGEYEVRAFIPSRCATTRLAKYHIRGAQWGRQPNTIVMLDQSLYYDEWVSLGTFAFDPGADPLAGQVTLNDLTPEKPPTLIAFDGVQWRRVLKESVVVGADRPKSDGVDSPVGDDAPQRAGTTLWPPGWSSPIGYNTLAEDGYTTGVGLLRTATPEQSQAVYAPMSGVITWVEPFGQWEHTLILDADPLADGTKVWLRFALLDQVVVQEGARVERGELLGHTGPVQGRFPVHLLYDVSKTNLSRRPWDWPGGDQARVQREYLDPLTFTKTHRPVVARAEIDFPLLGLHEGADWLIQNVHSAEKGWAVALWAYTADPRPQLDFSAWAEAGVRVLLRVGYGYADGSGTLPRPDQLPAFENAVVRALTETKGVYAAHYGNEVNNFSEWPSGFEITPDYYTESYNRVWSRLPGTVKLAPAPLDPYHSYRGSNPRDWWRAILQGIDGADGIVLHCKTQGNSPGEIESDARFTDPPLAPWQFLHFRTMETLLEDIPAVFKHLPVWITEANPQRLNNGDLGWEPNNGAWVTRLFQYVRRWNADPAHQAVHAVILYRYPNYDAWRLDDKPQIMQAVRMEAGAR